MWRLLHMLFGWHYVVLIAPTLRYTYLRRLKTTPNGKQYVNFPADNMLFIDGHKASNGYIVTALTYSQKGNV